MLHAKFKDHQTFGSEENDFLKVLTIYGHGGHLCLDPYTPKKLLFPCPMDAPHVIWL